MPYSDGMNWSDLRAFRAVAEELSFTRAAARLQMAQPTLSIRVRRLEEVLGVRLIERSTRRSRLTGAGLILADWVGRTEREWMGVRLRLADLPGTEALDQAR